MSNEGEESFTWRLPTKTDAYHLSSNASFFSVSLPDLFRNRLNFSGSNENINPCTEDNVTCPGYEDKVLADPEDDFDLSGLPTQIEDLDDDVFGIGGGLEMENESREISKAGGIDGSSTISQCGFANGEHPLGEHPSRTLFVRNINSTVEDSELRSLFEQYGDIRRIYTACKHRGFVMISYYDLRAAQMAMHALQDTPLRRRKLDIHFSIPKDNPSERDINQGSLVVFNLDPLGSRDDLYRIFATYGEIKEIRDTPYKRNQKFVEYYDIRAAEAALRALKRSEIYGKRIKVEPSQPGGFRGSLMMPYNEEPEQEEAHTLRQVLDLAILGSPQGTLPTSLHGYNQIPASGHQLAPVGSNHVPVPVPGWDSVLQTLPSGPPKIAPISKDPFWISQRITTAEAHQGVSFQQHFSVPSSKLSLSPGPVSPFSNPSSVGTFSCAEFIQGCPVIRSEQMNYWECPSALKGHQLGQGISRHSSFLGPHHHYIGSAPSGSRLDRNFSVSSEFTDMKWPIEVADFSQYNLNSAVNVSTNERARFTGNFTDEDHPSFQMFPESRNETVYFRSDSIGGLGDGMMVRGQGIRPDGGSQVDGKKQYELDLAKVVSGEDIRTTLMIKNIPNKYTSRMLLAAIDETHKGAYDFLYLPIDFKNKCNVGYAFINMVSPSQIITFYEAFNGKKWEAFNSEKVASLAYARIQGKNSLISHFQNSSLMNVDKSCQPVVFQSVGQEHLPFSNLNIFIRQPDGSYMGDPPGHQDKD